MSCVQLNSKRTNDGNLARAIEPLASYICAAERPKAALLSALAALRSEIEATNHAALAHFGRLFGEPMVMKYMLLIYMNENAMNDTERASCYVESTQLCHDLDAKGQFVAASPLHPVATATSVKLRDGKRLVTDGPFAETHEQLGGFFIVDAEDLDRAIAVAARIPAARKGTVEIRPVMEIPGLPSSDAVAAQSARS